MVYCFFDRLMNLIWILYQKNLSPIFNGGDFKEVLINFLENNLDKDTILDKINDMGIESLNEVDYKILKK